MGVEFLAHDEESLFAINMYTKTSDPEEHYHAVWKGAPSSVIQDKNVHFGEENITWQPWNSLSLQKHMNPTDRRS